MPKVTTNFGAIRGQRIITFAKPLDYGRIVPGTLRHDPEAEELCSFWDRWITPREAFRRWKIARKAWRSRKRRQLELGL